MFENLSDRLQGIFSGLRGKGRLTEDDINSAMREVRMAMLEADVNFKVVKQFVARTKERCLDAEVLDSLSPTQNVIKIVTDELTELLGRTDSKLVLSSRIPPATWGVSSRLGMSHRGLSWGRGSGVVTSRAAPHSRPSPMTRARAA